MNEQDERQQRDLRQVIHEKLSESGDQIMEAWTRPLSQRGMSRTESLALSLDHGIELFVHENPLVLKSVPVSFHTLIHDSSDSGSRQTQFRSV